MSAICKLVKFPPKALSTMCRDSFCKSAFLTVFLVHYFGVFGMMSLNVIEAAKYSGNATYYDVSVSLTACGQSYSNNDKIVALSSELWGCNATDSNPNHDHVCNKTINVYDASNSSMWMSMMVVDKCGSCREGDLDMSEACFQFFRNLSVGKFAVVWEFAT